MFRGLVEAGIDAVRINFAHTSHVDAKRILDMVKEAVRDTGRPIATIGDLTGPKIRVADLDDALQIESEEEYWFVPEGYDAPAGTPPERLIPTTYPELSEEVEPGNRILLDDGYFEFVVERVKDHWVMARAFS